MHVDEVQALTFDLWQTLLFDREGANSRRNIMRCDNLAKALGDLGIQVPAARFIMSFKEMSAWLASVWSQDKEVTHVDQIRFAVEIASGGSVKVRDEWLDRLSYAFVSPVFRLPPYLNPDAPALLTWAKDHGKRVGLICNVGHTPGSVLRRILQGEGVAGYFDAMIFSDEVGIRKPHKSIFELASQRLGVRPENITHIGDDLYSDIWGAEKAGLRAIHLCTPIGRDLSAEREPGSIVSTWKELSKAGISEGVIPDETVDSLKILIQNIGGHRMRST